MAKSKILTPGGLSVGNTPIIGQSVEQKMVPVVTGVKPCGSQILIEFLTAQELANTTITLSEKTDLKVTLQGYVRAAGPSFKPQEWGFNVGDRVLISGSGVMAPNFDKSHRDRFLMEPHSIKSVLVEE
jgi:hypothetical protein